ncbi:MAG: response regulator [bacterium]
MKKGRILQVDDDELVRITLGNLLRKHGHHVVSAADGFEAFEIFRNECDLFDIVLTDLCMPRRDDGLRLCEKIKEISNIPVILISGTFGLSGDLIVSGGIFDGFIQKPIIFDELFLQLERFSL